MSRFFVGQRVRVKWCETREAQPFIGREGRITEIMDVQWEGYGLDICPITYDGTYWRCFTSSQLEPILPEGHQPSEFTTLADLLASLEVTA